MPRPLKPRKRGHPPSAPSIDPEVVEALSLAGVRRERIAELLGLSVRTLERRFTGVMKRGPKMPAARVAALVRRAVELAEASGDVADVVSVIRLLGGLHLAELAASWQPKKDTGSDLPPIQPELGYAEPPDATP